MTTDLKNTFQERDDFQMLFEQTVTGSRKSSNFLVGSTVTIGGTGFLLASFSSYVGQDFLPIGHPASLIFVPQGLILGAYGIVAFVIAIYLWTLVAIDFGSGSNRFDKELGVLTISRRALLKEISLEIPLKEVKAVKLEVRDGINPRRRIALRVKGRREIPLTGAGKLVSLAELEKEGAELARFLGVNLEGL